MYRGKTDMIMGNLLREDLDSIWNGERFFNFFRNQLCHCRFCDTLKYKQAY